LDTHTTRLPELPGDKRAMTITHAGLAQPPTLRVLLAEDTRQQERLAVRLLEDEGHSVTVARNGKEAVEATEGDEFDLILMDVEMPVMDGLKATNVIRKQESTTGKRTPVIAVTATANVVECQAAGMDAHISKPLVRKVLRQTISKLLG
jgi:CheY-like chemotaxis protein